MVGASFKSREMTLDRMVVEILVTTSRFVSTVTEVRVVMLKLAKIHEHAGMVLGIPTYKTSGIVVIGASFVTTEV
jgi:hypothetical protein